MDVFVNVKDCNDAGCDRCDKDASFEVQVDCMEEMYSYSKKLYVCEDHIEDVKQGDYGDE